jgi:hypothetical protein
MSTPKVAQRRITPKPLLTAADRAALRKPRSPAAEAQMTFRLNIEMSASRLRGLGELISAWSISEVNGDPVMQDQTILPGFESSPKTPAGGPGEKPKAG